MKVVVKPWGQEVWLELNSRYCYKRLSINSGQRTSLQYHEKKIETNYVIDGEIELWLENEKGNLERKIMKKDTFFTIQPLRKHRIMAVTDVVLQEVSTPEVDDVIRIEDDTNRGDGRIGAEHKYKIGIFIPCYNVEDSVGKALESLSDEVLERIDAIIAVDNHSRDNTFTTLERIQDSGKKAGKRLVIIKNAENYGLGGSQKIAYRYFLDNDFTHFMIIHGDNQGNADDIAKRFLQAFDNDPLADLILASRFVKGSSLAGYNRARIAGNKLFNLLTFILTGNRMSDCGAGIIFYRTEVLRELPFPHLTNGCQFNPELNILLNGIKGLRVSEVPLTWKDSIEESNMRAVSYCLTLLKTLLNYRIRKTLLKKSGWQAFYAQSQEICPSFEIISSKLSNLAHTEP